MNSFEEIFNLNYNVLYYASAFVVLILVVEFYYKKRSAGGIQNILLPILLLIIVFLFGNRGVEVGVDTPNNIKFFKGYTQIDSLSELKDVGLYLVSILASVFSKSTDFFLTLLAFLYIIPIYIGIKNLKMNNQLIFFFVLFSFFFFKSMGINTQRQGLAFSMFFCGITYFINNKKLIAYFLFGLAFLFHASFIIPIIIFLFSNKIKKLHFPIALYILTTVLALTNFKFNNILSEIPIVNILVEDRLSGYFQDKGNYQIGFRPDFWLFNTIFALIGVFTYRNIEKLNFNKQNYLKFLTSYLFLSSYFFLMFNARFSDRSGFLGWIFILFLLYPYIISNKNIGWLNTFSVFLISVFLASIFKFI